MLGERVLKWSRAPEAISNLCSIDLGFAMMKKKSFRHAIKISLLPIAALTLFILSIVVSYDFGIVFFGLCAVVLTYSLVARWRSSAFNESEQQLKLTTSQRLNDPGIFQYTDTGFIVNLTQKKELAWSQVQVIIAYKVDLVTTDEICMKVFCDDDFSFHVTERTAGWFLFTQHLKDVFPSINKIWDVEITIPPFATNLTLIYDSKQRSPEQVFLELAKTNSC